MSDIRYVSAIGQLVNELAHALDNPDDVKEILEDIFLPDELDELGVSFSEDVIANETDDNEINDNISEFDDAEQLVIQGFPF